MHGMMSRDEKVMKKGKKQEISMDFYEPPLMSMLAVPTTTVSTHVVH